MLYQVSEVKTFGAGLDHPEGIAVARDDKLYTGGEAGQIYRIPCDGKTTEIIANTGGSCP
jgi:gluconolactonase